ncbi:MAG: cupin domain-containing protein [Gemmatimonadetes bacterium]|nr:cupin domain-containing protein [Gemmatimonadota bacterium]
MNLADRVGALEELWSPAIVARINDHEVKVARIEGEFIWHAHPETDEAFLVLRGRLRMDLRDGSVELGPGDLYVVPRGVEHRPVADSECHIAMIELAGTVNTGDAGGERTVDAKEWADGD